MDDHPDLGVGGADAVELEAIKRQLAVARERLRAVRHEIRLAEQFRDSSEAVAVLEANEQLVLALLAAQSGEQHAFSAQPPRPFVMRVDALTGLPDRALLLDRFACAAAAAQRRGVRMAVLFVDLDEFKAINDRLGHAVGDLVLQHAARCLQASMRSMDTVARHGGDEFVAVLADLADRDDAQLVARKMLGALAVEVDFDGHRLSVSASIGISIYPDDGIEAALLIRRADAAMYRAKRQGSACIAIHGQPLARCARLHGAPPPAPLRALVQETVALQLKALHEAQLQEANEHLLIAALGAQELQTAAEKALGEQTALLAVVAHELRNPLAPIRAAASMLDRVDAASLPRLRAVIERQVQHVNRLVSDLLDLSRFHTGKLRMQVGPLDMAVLIAESVESCRPAMDVRRQRLQLRVVPGPLPMQGDAMRLVQVLTNLLDNASKYTPENGNIRVEADVAGEELVLTVADDGIGITAQALPHVFKPFVQDVHATRFNAGGLGIGLAVVRELVEAHGGTVGVHSAGRDLGSQFVVTLPLDRGATDATAGAG
jgi:diguanylate cyclase (GGDEF)-like protein